MRFVALATLLVGAVLVAAAPKDEAGKSDRDRMQGNWLGKFVAGVDKGVDTRNVRVVIKDDNLLLIPEKSAKIDQLPNTSYHIVLFPDKKPKSINLKWEQEKGKRVTLLGIYDLKDDSLKILYSMALKGRPARFAPIKNAVGHVEMDLRRDKRPITGVGVPRISTKEK